MVKKIIALVLLSNVLGFSVIHATNVVKAPSVFKTALWTSAKLHAVSCALAGICFNRGHSIVGAHCLWLSVVSPISIAAVSESEKRERLTSQEGYDAGFADLFITMGASAGLAYFCPDHRSWLVPGLVTLIAVKSAYLWASGGQLQNLIPGCKGWNE